MEKIALMDFNFYHEEALKSAVYPNIGNNPHYPLMGLAGEVGEVAEKIKKLWRDKNQSKGAEFSAEDKEAIALELGDVLWYVSALAREIGLPLEKVASLNLAKLGSRKQRNKVHGSGDNR